MIPSFDRKSNEKYSPFVYETYRKRIIAQAVCNMRHRIFKQSKLPGFFNSVNNVSLTDSVETFSAHSIQLRGGAQMQHGINGYLQFYFFCTRDQKKIAYQSAEIITIDDTYKCNKEEMSL